MYAEKKKKKKELTQEASYCFFVCVLYPEWLQMDFCSFLY